MSEKHLSTTDEFFKELYEASLENKGLIAALHDRGSMTRSQLENEGYTPNGYRKSGVKRLLEIGVVYKDELDFKLAPAYVAMVDAWMLERGLSPDSFFGRKKPRIMTTGL
jgi:hypothetical protein